MNGPESAKGKEAQFSRREWLLAIALIMIAEHWILNTSFNLSGEQNVLNYVSFAGTISSILLAVIAIIYSFVQNESSQRSAGAIAAQIENLRGVTTKIQSSRHELEGQLNRIDTVTSKLDAVHNAVAGSEANLTSRLSEIKNALSAQEIKKPQLTKTDLTQNFNVQKAAQLILRATTYEGDLMAYSLHRYFSQSVDVRLTWVNFLRKHYSVPIAEAVKDSNNSRGGEAVISGKGFQILSTLHAFGVIKYDDNKKIACSEEIAGQLKILAKQIVDETPQDWMKPAITLIDATFA